MAKIVKNTTFPGLLDMLMPHSCKGCGRLGAVVCDRCKKHITDCNFDICPECKRKKTGKKLKNCPDCKDLPPVIAVGEREGLLAELIHEYKYSATRAIHEILAEILAEKIPEELKGAYLVPLPTSTAHIRERGFDHIYLIAKKLAKMKGYRVVRLLVREKNTVQVGADHKVRVKQAEGAFRVDERVPIEKDATYILLDDVWTTGASMKAATKKLREAGARKIVIVVLAVSG